MTFGAALRSILRQDPDIIMVGEMRDTETAEIAIRAAITGHLVLSTLHTNDAASTVTRLVDMGVEAYMVATSLIGIVAQRLTKVLCPECKKPRMSTEEENELMGLDHSVQVYDPCGCPKCNNTGYKGRTAIHEILLATPSMQALITRGAKADEIQELAKSYNRMLHDINHYVDSIIEIQKQKRQAEIHALQMQINPHYIYNTLTSIKWLIMQGDTVKSTKAIDAFIKLLRSTISKSDEYISVEEEIENLKNYMYINEIRYGEKIKTEFFICLLYTSDAADD